MRTNFESVKEQALRTFTLAYGDGEYGVKEVRDILWYSFPSATVRKSLKAQGNSVEFWEVVEKLSNERVSREKDQATNAFRQAIAAYNDFYGQTYLIDEVVIEGVIKEIITVWFKHATNQTTLKYLSALKSESNSSKFWKAVRVLSLRKIENIGDTEAVGWMQGS